MGVNLAPIVRNFSIVPENFTSSSHDVEDGCVTPGMPTTHIGVVSLNFCKLVAC